MSEEVENEANHAGPHGCYCCRSGGCADGCSCNARHAPASSSVDEAKKEHDFKEFPLGDPRYYAGLCAVCGDFHPKLRGRSKVDRLREIGW